MPTHRSPLQVRGDEFAPSCSQPTSPTLATRSASAKSTRSLPPIPITIEHHLAMSSHSTLRFMLKAAVWDLILSFASGIQVTRGNLLELSFADNFSSHFNGYCDADPPSICKNDAR